MDCVLEKRFPLNAKDYKLYEEVGEGVSATVYRALCIPLNEIVAIKVLDLEKCNNDLVSVLHLHEHDVPQYSFLYFGTHKDKKEKKNHPM